MMTTDYDIGYHILSGDAVEERGRFDEQMSIVEFLRRIQQMEDIPYDVTVYGLDDYLISSENAQEACQYIHGLLRDRVNFLMTRNPRILFIVDDLEYWDTAVIPQNDDEIPLSDIFHGSLEHEGADWFSSRLNVSS